jgi:hypothetical protein
MADLTFARAHEVTTHLYSELAVTEEQIHEAVGWALAARKRCTPFHPPSARGYYMWSESHVGLRQVLGKDSWRPSDAGGFSRVIRPDGLVAITVATGDTRTGLDGDPQPTTKYPRGPMSQLAVEVNQQIALDVVTGAIIMPPEPEDPKCLTWWLLLNVRPDEVRMEISLPKRYGEDNRIDAWSRRIILEPLGTTGTVEPDSEEDEMSPIDVPVERR